MANGILWFTAVCGNSSVDSAFWNPDVTINTDNPDLTECFQDTALVWGACGLLWLGALIYLPFLSSRSTVHGFRVISPLNLTKLICNAVIIATSIADLIHMGSQGNSYTLSKWLVPVIYIITMVLSSILTKKEFMKGENSSGLMFCFWLVLVLVNSIKLRTSITQLVNGSPADMFPYVTFFILYAVVFFEFVIHLFADNRALEGSGEGSAQNRESDEERTPLLGGKRQQPQQQEQIEVTKVECPEKYASFLNRMLYTWCSKLLVFGYKRQLTRDKLWVLMKIDRAEYNVTRFYDNWLKSSEDKSLNAQVIEDHEIETIIGAVPNGIADMHAHRYKPTSRLTWQTKSSLSWTIVRTYGGYFTFIGIYEVFNIILTYIRPLLLDAIINFVSDPDEQVWKGYFYAAMMFLVTLIRTIVNQLHFRGKLITGQRVRSSISCAVYRKTLLLSNSARREYSVGEIVNLMAVDAQRVSDSTFFIHNLWSAPVNIAVSMYMLWGYLGPSSFAGLAVLLLLISTNFFLVSKMKQLQLALMKLRDARTKLINEVLNGIKVIKLYAWEGPFQERISGIRTNEIQKVKVVAFYLTSTVVTFACAPILFTVVAFSVFITSSADGVLSAQVAFVSLTLVNSLTRPLTFLPNGIATSIQAFVSIRRLEKYLNQQELDHDMVDTKFRDENVLSLSDGTFSWDTGETTVLKDIDFTVKDGSLTAVVGQVGCGKSSLLAAVLGELHKVTGKLRRVGSIAYVPQEAWVRNRTLKDNVLFNKDLDERKYQRALDACALTADLNILPAGDRTEIGEKGINLSGGQKQRVSLARAVYHDADVYLMDDPLSAVDSHVGKHIFEQVLGPDGLLKYKTRILVTHGIAHLPKMDQIIVMKDGRISECGTYNDLIQQDGPFAEFMRTYLNHEEDEENGNDEELSALKRELKTQLSRLSSNDESEQAIDKTKTGPSSPVRAKSVDAKEGIKRRKSRDSSKTDDTGKKPTRGRRLIEDETAQVGGVNWSTLFAYMKTMSYAGIVLLIFFVLSSACELGSNIWLSEWSRDTENVNVTANQTMNPKLIELRLGVYAALGIGTGLTTMLMTVYSAIACYNASFVLHNRLLYRITRAPMSFFDTTPVGRILNRFSSDMLTVDSAVRMTVIQMLRGVSTIITTLIAISFSTPIFLATVVPLSIAYYFMQRFYVLSSNQLRRLVSVLTSPIYSHFGETISGAASIRAYQLQDHFIKECDKRIDDMMTARFAAIITNRWLSIWLEALSGLIVLFTTLFAVIARSSVSEGLVGLSVSYALQITDRLAMFVRNAADLENNVVAVERIHEYSAVEQEAPWKVEGNEPDPKWPEKGDIEVQNYSTRYRSGLELVLKRINYVVKGGEKIGVVGRTGAGKSSMTLSLFRIIEAVEGNIVIDSVITGKIGLHDLRNKLTIIPQDPVLFSGTLRFNLDPFNAKTDTEIFEALEHAHLKTFVLSLPEKLEFDCAEGGGNISVGQRQLVCLARALLRKTKILVLDEATAAVDLETDELIQTTIRTEFQNCTVITIAHRINTVMDYDRIMVMQNGEITEYDSPTNLLNDKNSEFYSMCKDAGLA